MYNLSGWVEGSSKREDNEWLGREDRRKELSDNVWAIALKITQRVPMLGAVHVTKNRFGSKMPHTLNCSCNTQKATPLTAFITQECSICLVAQSICIYYIICTCMWLC